MAANFDFLKKVDNDLYEIIDEAESLYRDEYFEQCMAQTRRFGENVCKKVLADKRTIENTFDEMLATLKDNETGEPQEKEFLDDLYFLKKHGNDAVHSSRVNRSGMDAARLYPQLLKTENQKQNLCRFHNTAHRKPGPPRLHRQDSMKDRSPLP